jgi:protocadherin-16/23
VTSNYITYFCVFFVGDSSSIPFVIDDQTGWIATREELDHEKRSKYILTVVARDGGNPRRESMRTVEVNVRDDNDDRPVFPSPHKTFQIMENVLEGTTVGRVNARDGDSGENGRVTYYIVGGNIMGIFGINMTDGRIYTVRNVDYETSSSHLLSIKAKDNSILNPKSSIMTVRIVILDLNDNPPIFSVDPVIITVQENSPPGRSTWTFSASDRDSGINGTIRYRIKSMSPNGDYFTIDAVTGELKTKSQLDHEQLKEMSIIIEASDQGPQSTRHVTAITVRVLIQDLNDNKPKFLSKNVIHVMEDEPIGFPMLHVLASDLDSGENGRITYSIVKGNEEGHFSLQETTGMYASHSFKP